MDSGNNQTAEPVREPPGSRISPAGRVAILLIRGYQKIVSPWLGPRCRFHPSCSNYCIDAVRQHGMVHGLWLGFIRICKCHPFHPGGYDPVPERKKFLRKRENDE